MEMNDLIDKDKLQKLEDYIGETEKNVEEIRSMVQDLTKISQKQNILALNASIEAARAGEAGRGFNIVAGEMGNLSAMATKQYSDIIKKAEDIDKLLGLIKSETKK